MKLIRRSRFPGPEIPVKLHWRKQTALLRLKTGHRQRKRNLLLKSLPGAMEMDRLLKNRQEMERKIPLLRKRRQEKHLQPRKILLHKNPLMS